MDILNLLEKSWMLIGGIALIVIIVRHVSKPK